MERLAFNVILRMPDYVSDGVMLLTNTDNKNIMKLEAVFTNDRMIGEYNEKEGVIYVGFLREQTDNNGCPLIPIGYEFRIDVDPYLNVPDIYPFSYEGAQCSFQVLEIELDDEKVYNIIHNT